jgi:hypothetical protein
MNDNFFTYVMFQPPGTGSNWVPIAAMEWNVKVGATKNGNGPWVLNPNPTASASNYERQEVGDEPTWDLVHPPNPEWVGDL